jgi:hypothetical protein
MAFLEAFPRFDVLASSNLRVCADLILGTPGNIRVMLHPTTAEALQLRFILGSTTRADLHEACRANDRAIPAAAPWRSAGQDLALAQAADPTSCLMFLTVLRNATSCF